MIMTIVIAVDALLFLALVFAIGKVMEMQEKQQEDAVWYEDRLDSLEDYADYIRTELMHLKKEKNADDDRADNYVRWRRRCRRTEAGD